MARQISVQSAAMTSCFRPDPFTTSTTWELPQHRCLVFSVGEQPAVLRLTQADETHEVSLTPTLSVNDLDILHDVALRGAGVALLPAYRCVDDLRAKRLERVLPAWQAPAEPVHAVYPSGRHLSPKVKAMLDHLQQLAPAPWASADGDGARPMANAGRVKPLRPRARPLDGQAPHRRVSRPPP